MSLGIYPVFKPSVKGAKFNALGEALAQSYDTLDGVAGAANLPLFSAFGDNRPVPAHFQGSPGELDETLTTCEAWFDASDGRRVFAELAGLIRSNPNVARRFEAPDVVADELLELVRVLDIADAEGAKFRLEMS
jgi:hypothetical protein